MKQRVDNSPAETTNGFQLFTTLVNLLWYLLYIALVCIITFSATSTGNFYLTKVLQFLFIDAPFIGYGDQKTSFRRSSNIDDFWAFMEKVIVPNLYQTVQEYNVSLYFDDAVINSRTGLEHENRLIGRARLRQIRVVRDRCPITNLVPLLSRICFPKYLSDHEDRRTINVGGIQGGRYFTERQLQGTKYWGLLDMYSGAGYTALLSDRKNITESILAQLKNHVWITRATRVVFLEFALVNPNINVFSAVRLAWEIPVTGGVTTSWDIDTAKLTLYSTPFEKSIFVCEILFIVFTVCFLIEEAITWGVVGCKDYFSSGWTYITFLIFVLSGVCITCSLHRYFTLNSVVAELSVTATANKFIDIHHLVYWETWYKNCSAILILLVWIKLFKYLAFNRSMLLISETLSRCAKDIWGYIVIFLIILTAFAQLGHIIFGNTVYGFSQFSIAIFTLWKFILGQFNYLEIRNANSFLGPIYFLAFTVFVFMILVNMFLAIINESYHFVQHVETIEGENRNMIKDCVACMTCACCRKLKRENNIGTFQDMNQIRIDPSEIKRYLTSQHCSIVNIEMFMERFNIAEDDVLDGNEGHQLLTDIRFNTYIAKTELFEKIKKRYPDENPLPKVTNVEKAKTLEKAEVEMLVERLGMIESAVVELVPKIERFLRRIELKIEGKKNATNATKQDSAPKDKRRSLLGSETYHQ